MSIFAPITIFYPPYIITAFVICATWLYWICRLSTKDVFLFIFNKEIWLNRESCINLFFCLTVLLFFNKYFKPIEEEIFQSTLSFLYKINLKKSFVTFQINPFFEGILATLVTMISIDGASYGVHRLMHKNLIFWKIHSLHHNVKKLNFFSTHRQNPLELIILNGARAIAAAIGLGLFHLLFPNKTPVILIQGLGAGFFIYMFTINLHHCHIPVRYPKQLCWLLISPHMHHIHHSNNPKHFGKNLGVVFSFWDRVFNTYLDEEIGLNELRFGLK